MTQAISWSSDQELGSWCVPACIGSVQDLDQHDGGFHSINGLLVFVLFFCQLVCAEVGI